MQQIIIYSRLVVQQIVVQGATDYAYAMSWMCFLCICNVLDVLCMVSRDSRCVSAVCACSPVELC